MDKINNNFDLDFSDLLRPILIDFLKYINRCLKVEARQQLDFFVLLHCPKVANFFVKI